MANLCLLETQSRRCLSPRLCRPIHAAANVQAHQPCFANILQLLEDGPAAWGYASFADIWADFTVFAVVRNPFERAASAYDYVLGRHSLVRPLPIYTPDSHSLVHPWCISGACPLVRSWYLTF